MARVATFQSGLCGFKVVYILRARMSVFVNPASLRGQSFGYALAPLDPLAEDSETFVEATRLSLFIGEDGVVNVSGPLKLYAPTDPIDCDEVPTFSKDNLFIKGISKVISTVPAYGIILCNKDKVPSGWAICNGGVYELSDGESYRVPNLAGPGGLGSITLVYIQKLPEGAEYIGPGFFFNSGLSS